MGKHKYYTTKWVYNKIYFKWNYKVFVYHAGHYLIWYKRKRVSPKKKKYLFEYNQKEITIREQNEIQNLYKCITQKPPPKAW